MKNKIPPANYEKPSRPTGVNPKPKGPPPDLPGLTFLKYTDKTKEYLKDIEESIKILKIETSKHCGNKDIIDLSAMEIIKNANKILNRSYKFEID